MKFCDDHWQRLRAAIEDRGLSHLIAKDGATAARQMKDELTTEKRTLANFDPLMSAHWAIVNNVMGLVGISLMAPDENGESRCPLCYLNALHAEHCSEPECKIDPEIGYDFWVDRAADDAKVEADRLISAEVAS